MRKKDTHIQTTSKSIALCDSIATIIQATLLDPWCFGVSVSFRLISKFFS